MKKPVVKVATPYGTFTRGTWRDYKFIAVLYLANNRWSFGGCGPSEPWAVWSFDRKGIERQVRSYCRAGNETVCLGIFEVPVAVAAPVTT